MLIWPYSESVPVYRSLSYTRAGACDSRARNGMWPLFAVQNLYFFYPTSLCIMWRICIYIYIYISNCVDILFVLPLLLNKTASESFLHVWSSAKCWLDIYHCGAGLAVTGIIYDTGQHVLQSSFQTGSSCSHGYVHIFFLIAFIEEAFVRNAKIVIICFNYIIKACNSNNNNNNNNIIYIKNERDATWQYVF